MLRVVHLKGVQVDLPLRYRRPSHRRRVPPTQRKYRRLDRVLCRIMGGNGLSTSSSSLSLLTLRRAACMAARINALRSETGRTTRNDTLHAGR